MTLSLAASSTRRFAREGVILTARINASAVRLIKSAVQRVQWALLPCVYKTMFRVARTMTCALSRRTTNAPRARGHCHQGRGT